MTTIKSAEKINGQYKNPIKKVICTVLAVALFCTANLITLSSCTSIKSTGLISSVSAKEYIGTNISTNPTLVVKSSQPSASQKDILRSLSVNPKADFDIKSAGNNYNLTFKSTLLPNTVYTVSSVIGGREIYQWAFQTVREFNITSVDLPQNSSDKTIAVNFTSENTVNFSDCFSVFPKTDGEIVQDGSKFTFTAKNGFLPQTEYTVTISKDIKNDNSQTLSRDMVYKFTTSLPTGNFASVEKNNYDYASLVSLGDIPQVMIDSRGLKSKNVTATVYAFSDYSSYMQAHKKYFSAPDFSEIDELISGLTKSLDFETSLDDYPQQSTLPSDKTVNRNVLVYPSEFSAGYYISEIKIDNYTLYHVFQVSGLSVSSFTGTGIVNVWVNSVKTGKPLTDTEVLLDSTYDKKTDENGVAVFDVAKDETMSRYILINDPNNGNVPYISYIRTKYDQNNSASAITGTLYSDSAIYKKNDTVKLFGMISAKSADKGSYGGQSVKSAAIYYSDSSMSVTPDSNGSFSAEVKLDNKFSGKCEFSLCVNGETDKKICSITVTVDDNLGESEYKAKSISDIELSADYDGDALHVYANTVSSTLGGSSLEYCESASQKNNIPMYYTGKENLDYTVNVIKRSLYKITESGKYFDNISKTQKTRYVYKRSVQDSTIASITGTTVNGEGISKIDLPDLSGSLQGELYVFKIQYKNAAEKDMTYTFEYGINDNSFTPANSADYTVNFSKTESISAGEKIKATLQNGEAVVTTGSLLFITESGGVYKSIYAPANSAEITLDENLAPSVTVYAAYSDSKNIYVLNKTTLKKELSPIKVSISSDKSGYSKGDMVNLQISAVDSEGKPIKAVVIINAYLQNKNAFVTNTEFLTDSDGCAAFLSGSYFSDALFSDGTRKNSIAYKYLSQNSSGNSCAYFGYVTCNGEGKAHVSFTAGEYSSVYTCTATIFYGGNQSRADLQISCNMKSMVDVSTDESITVNDDCIFTFAPNITLEEIPTEQSTTDDTTTIVQTTQAQNAVYSATTAIYSIPEKDLKKVNEQYKFDDATPIVRSAVSAAYNEKKQVNFGRLSSGAYAYKSDFEYNNQKYTAYGSFVVTAKNTVTVPKIMKIGSSESKIINDSQNSIKALIYDEKYQKLFETALMLCDYKATDLSGELAYLNSQKFFGKTDIDKSALTKYQSANGLLFNKNKKEDALLSACAAAVCPYFADSDTLIEEFEELSKSTDKYEMYKGLFGLSALHKPVLNTLNDLYTTRKSFGDDDNLYMALCFAFIGDFDKANALYNKLFDENGNITVKKTSDEIQSLICLLACKLNDEKSEALLEKVDSYGEDNEYYGICYAEYINGYVVNESGKDSAKIVVGDDEKTVSFDKSAFYIFDISAQSITSTYVTSTDKVYMCLVYTVSESEAKKLQNN